MQKITLKLLILASVLLIGTKQFAQCGSGVITLNSQQAVNDFPANFQSCPIFTGSIQISGPDISDLSPLAQLTSITGNLQLWGNPSLTSLEGLHNLTAIGGNLELGGYNFPLANLNGLGSLQTVGGLLLVQDFQHLVSVQAFSNLVTVTGSFLIQNNSNPGFATVSLPNLATVSLLDIRNNQSLASVSCPSLLSIGKNFHLVSNPQLVTASFPLLEVVGQNLASDFLINSGKFEIHQCNSLVNPEFPSLHTIKGQLEIIQNSNLMDLGFQNLNLVMRNISINSNPALASINGLSGLSGPITSLSIIGSGIANLNALENITSIGNGSTGDLILKDNPLLQNITGLGSLTHINRNLEIHNNDVLENLNGLNALSAIPYGYLSIQENAALEEINGLQNLSSVGISGDEQGVLIINNTALANLNGLSSLTQLKGGLVIRGNAALTDVSEINITSFLTGFANSFILEDNDSLPNLNGMYLGEVKGQVQILGNAVLESIGFSIGNPSQTASLLIDNNPLLQDISGLGSITQITGTFGGLRVINNDSLQNLDGLHITNLNGSYLFIKDNSSLVNIDSLSSLVTMSSNVSLEILDNSSLLHVDGLKNLTKAGRILIQNNPVLKNINGLSAITQLTMTSDAKLLSIYNNANLESIQGIRNISQATIANLVILSNPLVAVCDLKNICAYLGTAKPRSIASNSLGCNSVFEIQSSCPTVWNGTAWSDGMPNASKSALIEGNLDLTANLIVKNVTVNSGVFNIGAGGSLTASGTLTNNLLAENFTVSNNGNLVQTSDAALRKNQGIITVVKENTPFKRLDYSMWSSPVTDQNLFGFSPETVNGVTNYPGVEGRIYVYEGTAGYVNPSPFNQNTLFSAAKGYLFRAPNNWNETTATAYEGTFKGIPNNGTITVATHQNSFTSVGNPYPSSIDAMELLSANPDLGTLYFWTNTNAPQNGSYTQNNYATYTIAGGTSVNEDGIEPNHLIAAGQGFIAYNESTQVSFTNAMRSTDPTAFFRTTNSERHRIWLNLTGEGQVQHNQILISYMEGATQALDKQIDGRLFGYDGPALYSVVENEKLVIQGRALPFEISDVVQLGFKSGQQGSFSISLENVDGLFADGDIIIGLKDNVNGNVHNLMQGPYVFQSAQGEFGQRFELHYQSTLGIDDKEKESDLVVYKANGQIVVQSSQEIKSVLLYDLLGRLIHQKQDVYAKSYQVDSHSISQGVVIISIENDGLVATRKIVN